MEKFRKNLILKEEEIQRNYVVAYLKLRKTFMNLLNTTNNNIVFELYPINASLYEKLDKMEIESLLNAIEEYILNTISYQKEEIELIQFERKKIKETFDEPSTIRTIINAFRYIGKYDEVEKIKKKLSNDYIFERIRNVAEKTYSSITLVSMFYSNISFKLLDEDKLNDNFMKVSYLIKKIENIHDENLKTLEYMNWYEKSDFLDMIFRNKTEAYTKCFKSVVNGYYKHLNKWGEIQLKEEPLFFKNAIVNLFKKDIKNNISKYNHVSCKNIEAKFKYETLKDFGYKIDYKLNLINAIYDDLYYFDRDNVVEVCIWKTNDISSEVEFVFHKNAKILYEKNINPSVVEAIEVSLINIMRETRVCEQEKLKGTLFENFNFKYKDEGFWFFPKKKGDVLSKSDIDNFKCMGEFLKKICQEDHKFLVFFNVEKKDCVEQVKELLFMNVNELRLRTLMFENPKEEKEKISRKKI